MKKRNVLMMLFASACLGFGSFTAGAQVVTIEPFGDSVTTFGAAPESSYRYWLYQDFVNAGYDTNAFAFIGTGFGVENGSPANPWPDEEFAGHEGWDSGQALAGTPGAINVSGGPPNIVLLDFGANDAVNTEPLTNTEANLEAIIQDFAVANSSVVIILAVPTGFLVDTTLPPQSQTLQRREQSQLVSVIKRVAKTERKAGVAVDVVNLFSGYNIHSDTIDGTHPNVRGEQQIAKKFFNALRPVLKRMGVVPQRRARR